jgi:hypothetical protein
LYNNFDLRCVLQNAAAAVQGAIEELCGAADERLPRELTGGTICPRNSRGQVRKHRKKRDQ